MPKPRPSVSGPSSGIHPSHLTQSRRTARIDTLLASVPRLEYRDGGLICPWDKWRSHIGHMTHTARTTAEGPEAGAEVKDEAAPQERCTADCHMDSLIMSSAYNASSARPWSISETSTMGVTNVDADGSVAYVDAGCEPITRPRGEAIEPSSVCHPCFVMKGCLHSAPPLEQPEPHLTQRLAGCSAGGTDTIPCSSPVH